MNDSILGVKMVSQIGIIVKDIDETSKKFASFLGVDVPEAIITDVYDKAQTMYKNNPTAARAKLAFFQTQQGFDIELIEPDNNPSVWREFLDTHGEGVQHIAFIIKGMDDKVTKLAEIGMPLLQKGEYTGGRYAYIDSIGDLKVMIELLEND